MAKSRGTVASAGGAPEITPLSRGSSGAINNNLVARAVRGSIISNPSVIPLPDEEALKLRSKKKRARAAANTLGASNTILSDTYSGQTLG